MRFSALLTTALLVFATAEAAPHGGRHGDRPHRGRPDRPGRPDDLPRFPPGLFPPFRNRTGSDRPGRGRGRGRHGTDFPLPTGIIPTGIFPSGGLPTDTFPTDILPTDTVPTELPSDLPSGIFPTGGLPTGIFPPGGVPTGIFPTGGLPTGILPTTLVPTITTPVTEAPTSTSVDDIETVSFVFPSSSAGIPIPPGARPGGAKRHQMN